MPLYVVIDNGVARPATPADREVLNRFEERGSDETSERSNASIPSQNIK